MIYKIRILLLLLFISESWSSNTSSRDSIRVNITKNIVDDIGQQSSDLLYLWISSRDASNDQTNNDEPHIDNTLVTVIVVMIVQENI